MSMQSIFLACQLMLKIYTILFYFFAELIALTYVKLILIVKKTQCRVMEGIRQVNSCDGVCDS